MDTGLSAQDRYKGFVSYVLVLADVLKEIERIKIYQNQLKGII